MEDNKLVQSIRNKLKYLEEYRLPAEKIWWEIQNFIDGFHYNIQRDMKDNTVHIEQAKIPKGTVRRAINLLRKVDRELSSMLTVSDYRWIVIKTDGTENTEEKYLRYLHRKLNLSQIISEAGKHAFRRSVGYVEIDWDTEAMLPIVTPLDPFVLYEDPQGKFFIKAINKRKKDLLEAVKPDGTPLYDKEKIDKLSKSNTQAQSPLYNLILDREHPSGKQEDPDLDEIRIFEEHSLAKGNLLIRTMAGEEIIREDQTDHKGFKFLKYRAQIDGELYNQPWLQPLLDPSKSINRTINHIEEWIKVMQKGRYFIRKNTNFKELRAEHGHIYRYDGRKPEAEQPVVLPPTSFTYLDLMVSFLTQLSGVRLNPPAGALSGKALAYMQAMDQQNAIEPLDNLKVFLRELATRLIDLTYEKLSTSKEISYSENGTYHGLKIIGGGTEAGKTNTFKRINKVNDVEVEIVPGGALAKLNQIETAKEMYKMQAIDLQTLNEIVAIGPVADIIARRKKEMMEEEASQIRVAQATGAPATGALPSAPLPGGGPSVAVAKGVKEVLPGKKPLLKPAF